MWAYFFVTRISFASCQWFNALLLLAAQPARGGVPSSCSGGASGAGRPAPFPFSYDMGLERSPTPWEDTDAFFRAFSSILCVFRMPLGLSWPLPGLLRGLALCRTRRSTCRVPLCLAPDLVSSGRLRDADLLTWWWLPWTSLTESFNERSRKVCAGGGLSLTNSGAT